MYIENVVIETAISFPLIARNMNPVQMEKFNWHKNQARNSKNNSS